MTYAVVIPVYNGLEHLQQNLLPVLALKAHEYIFVDDASTDDSATLIARHKKIKLLRHDRNLGFTQTVNDCFASCTADIVFLLNQDVLPDVKLIKHTLPLFADQAVAAVTFNEQDRSWPKPSFTNGFISYANGPKTDQPHASFWASGGSAAFRRDVWVQVGGFDPLFSPGYFEDFDLGYRLHKSGYQILWSPQSNVAHSPETTFNQTYTPRQLARIKDRNFLLVHWKNLDVGNLINHVFALLDRILTHPGFLVPTLMALWHLPSLKRQHYPVTDAQVFAKFT